MFEVSLLLSNVALAALPEILVARELMVCLLVC